MSSHSHAPASEGGTSKVLSAQPDDSSPEEISRRTFMAKATIGIGGLIGLGLAIPIVGALLPDVGSGGATWTPLDEAGWKELQATTEKAVQIDILLKSKEAYLPEQSSPQSVWGIKVKNQEKFIKDRPDLFNPTTGKDDLPYKIVNMGFVIFSPICPHLGCYYSYDAGANKFACPCHGSQYDHNGAHIAGPAARGLDPLPLREHSGVAQIEWIRYESTTPSRIVVSYTA